MRPVEGLAEGGGLLEGRFGSRSWIGSPSGRGGGSRR